jgi:ABC-type Fe3+/spermidine/putrescine transport system ATPase subunit
MSAGRFEFCSVSKLYGKTNALTEVSLTLTAGEPTALLGRSGCGKSTLLRLLSGLEPPTSGRILLDGKVISDGGQILLPPHQRGIAMVFQDMALWPNLTALENVRLGLSGTGRTRQETRRRSEDALALCGIADLAQRKPGQLSGGQQQRVALARAIAVRPEFLLLDEPFAGIDIVMKASLLQEIAALAAEQRLTVVLVSHDPVEGAALCRSAIVLEDGRVSESGLLPELIRDSQSPIFKAHREQMKAPSVQQQTC